MGWNEAYLMSEERNRQTSAGMLFYWFPVKTASRLSLAAMYFYVRESKAVGQLIIACYVDF